MYEVRYVCAVLENKVIIIIIIVSCVLCCRVFRSRFEALHVCDFVCTVDAGHLFNYLYVVHLVDNGLVPGHVPT